MSDTDEEYIKALKAVSDKYPNSIKGFSDHKFTTESSQIYQSQLNVLIELTINLNKKDRDLDKKINSLGSKNKTISQLVGKPAVFKK